MCHPNADSYRDLSPKQIYRIHENEKKRKYNSHVTEIEQDTFTPLVFTTTGEIADECLRYPKISRAIICKKARELRHNNFMGQGESVLCNFAERAPMPPRSLFYYSFTKFVFNFQFEKSLIKYVPPPLKH